MPTIISGDTGVNQITAGAIERADLPSGSVLQVVNATHSTETSTTSNTLTDTGLSISITPSSSSSKILIFVNQQGVNGHTTATNSSVKLALLRNTTALYNFEVTAGYDGESGENNIGGCGTTYLDSPSTTSSVTYKTQFAQGGNSGSSAYVQKDGATSTITLMEIAA